MDSGDSSINIATRHQDYLDGDKAVANGAVKYRATSRAYKTPLPADYPGLGSKSLLLGFSKEKHCIKYGVIHH